MTFLGQLAFLTEATPYVCSLAKLQYNNCLKSAWFCVCSKDCSQQRHNNHAGGVVQLIKLFFSPPRDMIQMRG